MAQRAPPLRTLYVAVNGLQLLSCLAPPPSPPPTVAYAEYDAASSLAVMADHGRFELSFVMYASSVGGYPDHPVAGDAPPRGASAVLSSDLPPRHAMASAGAVVTAPPWWVLYLTIDDAFSVYLGRLSAAPSNVRTLVRYVPAHPTRFRLTVATHELTQPGEVGIVPTSPFLTSLPSQDPSTYIIGAPGGTLPHVFQDLRVSSLPPSTTAASHHLSRPPPPSRAAHHASGGSRQPTPGGDGRHPEEGDLIEEVVHVLVEAMGYGLTSVAISHVLNKVEPLELYRRVVGVHYRGRFAAFLSAHSAVVVVLTAPGQEPRVGLTRPDALRNPVTVPTSSEIARREEEAVQVLCEALRHGDLTLTELLSRTRDNTAVTQNWHASGTVFGRFLQAHTKEIWVVPDPIHTTRIGLQCT